MKWLIILGMHRSGTSALAGELHHHGVWFGEHFIELIEDVNRKGFYEHRDLVSINQTILTEMQQTWFDCFAVKAQLEQGFQPSASVQQQMRELLTSDEFAGRELCGLKDPRMSLLWPLWREQIQALGHQFQLVVVNREPSKIAYSLYKRDTMPYLHSELLWQGYTLAAFLYASQYPAESHYIETQALLTDPASSLLTLFTQLGLSIPVKVGFIDATIPSSPSAAQEHPLFNAITECDDPIGDLDWLQLSAQFYSQLASHQDYLQGMIAAFYALNQANMTAITNGDRYSYAMQVISDKDHQLEQLNQARLTALATIEQQTIQLSQQQGQLDQQQQELEQQQALLNYYQSFSLVRKRVQLDQWLQQRLKK